MVLCKDIRRMLPAREGHGPDSWPGSFWPQSQRSFFQFTAPLTARGNGLVITAQIYWDFQDYVHKHISAQSMFLQFCLSPNASVSHTWKGWRGAQASFSSTALFQQSLSIGWQIFLFFPLGKKVIKAKKAFQPVSKQRQAQESHLIPGTQGKGF